MRGRGRKLSRRLSAGAGVRREARQKRVVTGKLPGKERGSLAAKVEDTCCEETFKALSTNPAEGANALIRARAFG